MTMYDSENNIISKEKPMQEEVIKKHSNWAAYLIAIVIIMLGLAGGVFWLSEKISAYIDTNFIQAGISQEKLN